MNPDMVVLSTQDNQNMPDLVIEKLKSLYQESRKIPWYLSGVRFLILTHQMYRQYTTYRFSHHK